MTAEEQTLLDELFGPGVQEHCELGLRVIVLPSVVLPDGCTPEVSSGVFVAGPWQGYASRLYLEMPVRKKSGEVLATTSSVWLGRTLSAASIRDIDPSLPLHQAISAHVRWYRS
jgi:hypothetical protein